MIIIDQEGEIRLSVWIFDNCPQYDMSRRDINVWCANNIWAWDRLPRSRKREMLDDWQNFRVIDEIVLPSRGGGFVARFKERIKRLFRRGS